jgi:hypothetical protein
MQKKVRARVVEGILTDEEIEKELARLRDRNLEAQLASQKVAHKTRQENLLCRRRYEKAHRERIKKEVENSMAHLKVFGNMYDNSPFGHNVGGNYQKNMNKRLREQRQEAIYQATYKKLEDMTGRADNFIVNWADKDCLSRVMKEPANVEVLKHKQTTLDVETLRDELSELVGMVDREVDTCLDKFSILEKTLGAQPRTGNIPNRPSTMEFAKAELAGTPINKATLSSSSPERVGRPGTGRRTPTSSNKIRHQLNYGSPIEKELSHHSHSMVEQDSLEHHDAHHHTYTDRNNTCFENNEHHRVIAGEAVIWVTGPDGRKHKKEQDLDELEGKIDHHAHKPGDPLWDSKKGFHTTNFSRHNVLPTNIQAPLM